MRKISDIDINNRPREKLLHEGVYSLSDEEILAIIIRCGTKEKSSIELAKDIIEHFEGISKLVNADIYDLMTIKGVKKAKACEIIACLELVKRVNQERNRGSFTITEAAQVYELIKSELENELQENFMVLYLNIKSNLIKKEILFVGGETSSLVDINLILKKALIYGARKIICVHNHPSGDCRASQEDMKVTERIQMAGKLVNVALIDHIIIGKDSYFSFAKSKLL